MTATLTQNTHTTFADLLQEYEIPTPQRGQILEGEIMRIEDDALFIDVGAKRDAIVPYHEVIELNEELLSHLSRGDEVPVYVVRTPRGNEELIVSLNKGLEQQDWQKAARLMADEKIVECEIIGHNKGGILVQFGRVRGFVPNSHIPAMRHLHNTSQRNSFKSKQVGQTVTVKVIEVSHPKERLVFSIKEAQAEKRRQRLLELNVGDVINGRVVNLTKYGAFIDLGGVDGLLHISQMSWTPPNHPADLLSVGDEIEVLIEGIDTERGRINLNHKILLPTPFTQFAQDHHIGDEIEGTITTTVDFGAFVEVAEGVEGLIHISKLSDAHVNNPQNIVQPGDTVLVHILNIDVNQERLALSLDQVLPDEPAAMLA
ncbi:MAG: S1 RNA-binding domain-containing protein [Ardenticatenaceae bacterium]|nr:S1 RNA-binding domain-containing protein [Ardenticatenaceae bacterium]